MGVPWEEALDYDDEMYHIVKSGYNRQFKKSRNLLVSVAAWLLSASRSGKGKKIESDLEKIYPID